jgi:hypothetical protein
MSQLSLDIGAAAPAPEPMRRGAVFSDCQLYRYTLWRQWGPGEVPRFLMLNPSTATAELDDPTIRRCMGFARAWGCGGIVVLNIFAFRATDPADMKRAADPIGPENDEYLRSEGQKGRVICAWGAHGSFMDREAAVVRLFDGLRVPLYALALTGAGSPRHPLYLKGDLKPTRWR